MKIFLILAVIVISLSACTGNQEVPVKPSEEKTRKMPAVAKEETVGEASTKILDTGINRVNNINIACSSISGTKINVGEEFSFNNVVGERSESKGYKDAPIIVNGEKSYGIGGGICQVSSTIYMAAVNAGMKITERHTHSEPVAYAPGTDATVTYGHLDMKFKNTTDKTVYIYTWVQDERVYAKIVEIEYDVD